MNNRKKALKIFRKQNLKMLPLALLLIPYNTFMFFLGVGGFLFVIVASMFKWERIKNFYTEVFTIFKNCNLIYWYSLFPSTYRVFTNREAKIDSIDNFVIKKIGVWQTENLYIIKNKLRFDIIEKENVVWIYLSHTVTRVVSRYGGRAGIFNDDRLIFRTDYGAKYTVPVDDVVYDIEKRELKPSERVVEIMEGCPHAALGYNFYYEMEYKKNPKEFKNRNNHIQTDTQEEDDELIMMVKGKDGRHYCVPVSKLKEFKENEEKRLNKNYSVEEEKEIREFQQKLLDGMNIDKKDDE